MTEKAYIEILDQTSKTKKIEVMFNPESYHISYAASYSQKKILGLDGPISQYISGENMTLDMTLYFDTYEPPTLLCPESGKNVGKLTKQLSSLLFIEGSLHRPPTVKFCWGGIQFKGFVTSIKESYTMFLSDGTPVRAKADITFQSLLEVDQCKRQAPFESPDRTKVRVLLEKEQLWNYAWQEYNDAEQWRLIAKTNGILNPLDLKPGTKIKIPAL